MSSGAETQLREAASGLWLDTRRPDHRTDVQVVLEAIKLELRLNAEWLVQASDQDRASTGSGN